MKRFTFLILLVFSVPASVAQSLEHYKALIVNNLSEFDKNHHEKWAYTTTREVMEDEKTQVTVAQYDPRKPEGNRWVLVSDNGKAPDAERVAAFVKEKAKTEQLKKQRANKKAEQKETDKEQKLIDMVMQGTLKLVDQNDQTATLSFTPNMAEMGEESRDKLQGKLVIDKKANHVSEMTITNIKPLSPAFSVTLEQFALGFFFTRIDNDILPKVISIDMQGKAALFKTIEQHSRKTFSDYQAVGQNAAP